jgi:hypothetical protein
MRNWLVTGLGYRTYTSLPMPLLHSRATLAYKSASDVNPRSFTSEPAAEERQHVLYPLTNVTVCIALNLFYIYRRLDVPGVCVRASVVRIVISRLAVTDVSRQGNFWRLPPAKIGSLDTEKTFPITHVQRFATCFGSTVLSIRDSDFALKKVFLPRRYREIVIDEDIDRFNSNKAKLYLFYRGVCTDEWRSTGNHRRRWHSSRIGPTSVPAAIIDFLLLTKFRFFQTLKLESYVKT